MSEHLLAGGQFREAARTILATRFPWCADWEDELRSLFAEYVKAKQRQHVLDYDDLLLYWAEMLWDETFAQEIGGRFDHVLVDEYQDTNRLQAKILLRLKPGGRGVMVVGDDAQAIYSFRAATVRNILDFPDKFSPQPASSPSNKIIGPPSRSWKLQHGHRLCQGTIHQEPAL